MLPPERPKIKTWDEETEYVWAHGKLDGIMLTCCRADSGLLVYTRHKDPAKGDVTVKVETAPWYGRVLDALAPGDAVMGELWLPGTPRSAVKGHWSTARFSAFAFPTWRADISLTRLFDFCRDHGIEFAPFRRFEVLGSWDLDDPRSADPDLEGFVLKDGNTLNWAKHKAERTIDLVVGRIKAGSLDGQFVGMCGSLVLFTSEGHEVCNASGMPYEIRRAITDADVGRVCEVRYQYVGSKGRLAHPRFLGWRDDKSRDECSREQDPNLDAYWKET